MIELYFWTTPNGMKPLILLEETGLAHTIRPVNISKGEHFTEAFTRISPNQKIPAIVDRAPAGGSESGGAPIALFESGAILQYLAEKSGQFLPQTQPKRVLSTLNVPHLSPRLSELSCPILAFWGQDDKFCPVSGATTIAEQCKNARVTTITECGHWVMVEHTDLFNRMCVDFLEHG